MHNRREDILLHLKAAGSASLAEVAAALGVTKQGALRHLDQLVAEGLVTAAPLRSGRGRPASVYSLAAAAAGHFPQGHKELAQDLVTFLPSDQVESFFKRRARQLEPEYRARLSGLNSEERVHELARLATERGHMADVAAGEDGTYEIRQHNCPIADVAALTGHPCQVEQRLYEKVLGARVTRGSWIPDRASSCTYIVKFKGGVGG